MSHAGAAAPEVSVVMPCLNEEAAIGVCIEKIRRTFDQAGLDGEIVVCDNGSTDRSVEIARGYAARDPRVGVIVNPPGFNYFCSMNRAIAGSTAEFFCPWACDDVMDPDNLVQKVAALLEHADAGFAWSPTLIVDDHGRVADFFPDVTQVEPYMAAPDSWTCCCRSARWSCRRSSCAPARSARSAGSIRGRRWSATG